MPVKETDTHLLADPGEYRETNGAVMAPLEEPLPLIQGGQGRSARDVAWSAGEMIACAIAAGMLVGACLVAALLKK